MSQSKEKQIRIFQVVTLGEKLGSEDIARLLKEKITLNPKKPDVYFTVTEQIEEAVSVKP